MMRVKVAFTIAFTIAFMLLGTLSVRPATAAEAEALDEQAAVAKAVATAEAWLALLDAESYETTWEEAASIFKNAVPKEEWIRSVKAVMEPLGPVEERTLEQSRYTTELRGAPDGQYVVLVYRTRFAYKKESLETVTPMLDKDGTWRVSGYYIK